MTFKDICSFEAADANKRTRSDGGECFCVKLRSAPEFRPRVFNPSAPQLARIISLTFQTRLRAQTNVLSSFCFSPLIRTR